MKKKILIFILVLILIVIIFGLLKRDDIVSIYIEDTIYATTYLSLLFAFLVLILISSIIYFLIKKYKKTR